MIGRHILPLAAALAAAAAASPAFAADIPGGPTTKATLPISPAVTSGAFEKGGDSDWYRVQLVKGRDYSVSAGGATDCCSTVHADIRDATGKVLASVDNDIGDATDGFEFRAPASGTYFLEYKETFARPDAGPFGYGARISGDCAGTIATQCTISPGATVKGLLAFGFDADLSRTTLAAGKPYTITGKPGPNGDTPVVALLDKTGKKVAGGTGPVIKGFRPKAAGTYYVKVATAGAAAGADDFGTTYTVTLSTP